MSLYIPAHFRVDDPETLFAFISDNAFGTLVTTGPDGLHVSHIPFIPERSGDGKLRLLGHVARANPQASAIDTATDLVAIFQGPHAYVSPRWYEHHPAVPTWNYAVAHVRGRIAPLDEFELRDLLGRLSTKYEGDRPDAWRVDKAPAPFIEGLVGVIRGFAVEVERVEGKFKLSQNRPGDDAQRVADALESQGEASLAALMREHLPARQEVKSKP
jgi:transcriptional regulator